jgi:hypothetical protein
MAIPSIIDLTFAIQGIINQIQDWQVMPDLGSDHFRVLFTVAINSSSSNFNSIPRFNIKKAN